MVPKEITGSAGPAAFLAEMGGRGTRGVICFARGHNRGWAIADGQWKERPDNFAHIAPLNRIVEQDGIRVPAGINTSVLPMNRLS
jgi:hypothetical protein